MARGMKGTLYFQELSYSFERPLVSIRCLLLLLMNVRYEIPKGPCFYHSPFHSPFLKLDFISMGVDSLKNILRPTISKTIIQDFFITSMKFGHVQVMQFWDQQNKSYWIFVFFFFGNSLKKFQMIFHHWIFWKNCVS